MDADVIDTHAAAITLYMEEDRRNETLVYGFKASDPRFLPPTLFEAMERYICEGRVTVVLGMHYHGKGVQSAKTLYWHDERLRDLGYPVSDYAAQWETYRDGVRDCIREDNPYYKHRLWLERNGKPKE